MRKIKKINEKKQEIAEEIKKENRKFWSGFKAFIAKGNIIDLAVAVIIGTAFNRIIQSLVNDIIMPIFTGFTGNQNISDLKFKFFKAEITYGAFLQVVIEFLIISITLYFILEYVLRREKKRKQKLLEIKPVVLPTKTELLLEEILNELKTLNPEKPANIELKEDI